MTSAPDTLNLARRQAEAGRFAEFRVLCQRLAAGSPADLPTQLNVGALLSGYGLLSDARACYERARTIAPTDQRVQVNLANLARDTGDHGEARRLGKKGVRLELIFEPDPAGAVPTQPKRGKARASTRHSSPVPSIGSGVFHVRVDCPGASSRGLRLPPNHTRQSATLAA